MPDEGQTLPPQKQERQPGLEAEMHPRPASEDASQAGCGRLAGKVALVTGGDSGIGRAVCIAFAKEGADVAIAYLNEHEDAEETKHIVEQKGRSCITLPGDIGYESHCEQLVDQAVARFGHLDILVNNAAEQHPRESLEQISSEQLERTFRSNIYAMFFLTKSALRHMGGGCCIINTSSVTAYRGSSHLLDYSSTKGAIVSFTRSLALNLAPKKIRVNAVAPGPIWTPLIPATFTEEQVGEFGADVPLGRPGQPEKVAPSFVFLASNDSSYMTGQVLHPNGGEIING